jgi:hypothetical protein
MELRSRPKYLDGFYETALVQANIHEMFIHSYDLLSQREIDLEYRLLRSHRPTEELRGAWISCMLVACAIEALVYQIHAIVAVQLLSRGIPPRSKIYEKITGWAIGQICINMHWYRGLSSTAYYSNNLYDKVIERVAIPASKYLRERILSDRYDERIRHIYTKFLRRKRLVRPVLLIHQEIKTNLKLSASTETVAEFNRLGVFPGTLIHDEDYEAKEIRPPTKEEFSQGESSIGAEKRKRIDSSLDSAGGTQQ